MMYGAYSTTRRLAVSRIFLRFIWFSLASIVISFLYVYVKLLLLNCHFHIAFSNFPFYGSFYILLCDFLCVCRKALEEDSSRSDSVMFKLYVIVIAIYGGIQFFLSILMRIPTCHNIANKCDRWPVIRFFKWMRQVLYFIFLFCSSCLISGSLITISDAYLIVFSGETLRWPWHV